MMKRRFVSVLAVMLALTVGLLGCGGSGGKNGSAAQAVSSSVAHDTAASTPMAAPMEPYFPEPEEAETSDIAYDEDGGFFAGETSGAAVPAPPDARKIIRHANMDLETMEFDAAMAGIQKTVADAGGYIESQSQGGGTSYAVRGRYQEERYANIQARIPSEKLDGVMGAMGGLCNVLSQGESMDDITDSYYDSKARLSTLELQEERLLAILEKAERLEDVITLESALSDVRYRIESLTAAIRRMDSQVAYSYLNLYLQEVVEYQQVQERPRTFGERMREAAGDGVEAMVDGLQEFSIAAVRVGPSLLVWAVIIAAIVLVIRALVKANGKRREAKGLPPKKPPLTYTTGGRPGFQRYPKGAPDVPPTPPTEEKPREDGE